MFKTYPKAFTGGTVNGNVDFEGTVKVGNTLLENIYMTTLDGFPIPINASDISENPTNTKACANDGYVYIYSQSRGKWGRIAIDTANW